MASDETAPEWHLTTDPRTSAYWSERPFVSGATRTSLTEAEVLLVPWEDFRDTKGPLFPAGTSELFQFLKDRAPDTHIEVCADDAEYKELALHGDIIFLGTILMQYIVAPVFVALLAEFIKKQLPFGVEKAEVRAHLLIEQGTGEHRRVVRVDYEGPAAKFELSMPTAIEEAAKQFEDPNAAPALSQHPEAINQLQEPAANPVLPPHSVEVKGHEH